jgi:hypothetical protein
MTVVVLLTAPVALQVLPLLGIVYGVSVPAGEARRAAAAFRGWRGAWKPSFVAVLLLSGMLLASNSATRARFEVTPQVVSPVLAGAAQSASSMWAFDAHLAFLAGRHWAFVGPSEPQASQLHLSGMERASRLDSRNPYYPLEQAVALRFYGRPASEIEREFSEAYRRYPFHPFARAERALFLIDEGRYAEARSELDVAKLADVSQVPQLAITIQSAEDTLDGRY